MEKYKFLAVRFLIYIAILCAALMFPVATATVTAQFLVLLPTLLIAALAYWLSHDRRRTLIVVGVGAFVGRLVSPNIQIYWSEPPTFWDHFQVDFYTIGLYAAGGALVFAVAEYVVACSKRAAKINSVA